MSPPHVRAATLADYGAFARLLPELGTDNPVPNEEQFRSLFAQETLVAECDRVVVGYVYGQRLKETGYVRHLVTASGHRGRGVGRTLLAAIRARFADAGCDSWCLNVAVDNAIARALYGSVGMAAAYESVALRFDWTAVDSLGGDAIEARTPEQHEDRAIEVRFDLPEGQLAYVRRQGTRAILTVDLEGQPAAIAVFDPAFPGSFPFRVARPSLARALLEGCRRFARPELDFMQVVAEDDPALAEALVAIGATVQLELVHYRGTLVGGATG